MVFQLLSFFYCILTVALSHTTNVEYVDGGAILRSPGEIRLNNPDPITISIEDFALCPDSFTLCYKSIRSTTASTFICDVGFCPLRMHVGRAQSNDAQTAVDGNAMQFTLNHNNPCIPDMVNGYHTYRFASLPSGCRVIVKKATDPTRTTTTTTTTIKEDTVTESVDYVESTSEKTSDAMIWGVVGGGVGLAAVVMVIAAIVFIFAIRPCLARRAANQRRNRANAAVTSKILPTPASKTNPTAAKTPEVAPVPEPSTTQSKQEPGEPETAAPSKPTPSEEPEPEDEPAAPKPKPKKVALTPADYEELVPIVESVLASLNRLHHIDRDVLESVFARWPPRHIHDVWKLEKIILQARADESIEALNQLTAELDIGLLKNKAKYGSNDSPDEAWEYANFEGLPASACHRLFAMSYPDVFKGIEGRLDDPIIEKLSVPGLYCCLMSDAFDQEFKKKLIVELRARSVKVISQVHPDELFFSAFPMYYLAHKYKVDKDNFVEGFKKPDVRKSTKFGL